MPISRKRSAHGAGRKKYPSGMPVTLVCSKNEMSGYGSLGRSLHRELTRLGFVITREDAPLLDGIQARDGDPADSGSDRGTIRLRVFPPCKFKRIPDAYTIGYLTHETTMLPPGWAQCINCMDEVWVLSEFNRKTLLRSGVRIPIEVMPPPIDTGDPESPEAPFELHGHFCFLSVGCAHYYKGFDILLEAYLKEFSARDEVCLIVKTYSYFHDGEDEIREILAKLQQKISKDNPPLIILIDDRYCGGLDSVYFLPSMGPFYAMADACISTSRGEGFGLTLLEAMARGIPVISSNFGGPGDYLTEDNAFLLDYDLVDVCSNGHPFHGEGQWAEASIAHTGHIMRYVFEHREEASVKAAQAGRDFQKRWSARRSSEKIVARLLEIRDSKR